MSAAVAVKGEIVWAGSIGYADIKNEKRATSETTYRFGSIAKSITSTALIKLDSQGTLDIDLPFIQYAPDWQGSSANYTLADLASHQAGIRHYGQGLTQIIENLSDTPYVDLRDAAKLVESDTPLFSPGEGYHYTTYGYTLLGLAIERATNKDFGSIVQRNVLEVAGMSNTTLQERSKTYPRKAVSYLTLGSYNVAAPKVDMSFKYPGGGYLSTPSDIVKFGSLLLNEDHISQGELAELVTPKAMKNGEMNPDNYGLGFSIGSDEIGRRFFHGGGSVGGSSFLVIYPDQKMVIALTSNVTPGEPKMDRHKDTRELGLGFQ